MANLITRDEVEDVVNATDAGREGELIFDLVYRLAGCRKPVLRFWTSSLTDESILEAYANMKSGDSYIGLRDAARSRQEADWLVGINCTRAQTIVMQRQGGEGVFSIGRVQTPTLAILVNREQEILNFVPKDFWTLWAVFDSPQGSYKGKWFKKLEDKELDRFDKEEDAKSLVERLGGLPGRVASVNGKTEKKRPELLYDLTALQKEANKRFGFTAEHTLEVAQGLYESKLISYPRTNSRHLTEADAAKVPGWIRAIAPGQLVSLHPFVTELRERWPVKLDKRFVDDKEVEDHSALVPTENAARNLAGDALLVYELIARRFLAAFFPERVESRTTIITKIGDETFKTIGTVVKELGWSKVDPPHVQQKREKKSKEVNPEIEEPDQDESEENSGVLPAVSKGQEVPVAEIFPKAGKTTPPKRLSEGDLLASMQGAGRELADEELKGAMKDCGLGTPATRASIIETLLKRNYVIRKRNILQPTEKGFELLKGLKAESLKSPQLTGEWEARLERMRRQEVERGKFMEDVKNFVSGLIDQIRGSSPLKSKRVFGPAVGICMKCGGNFHLNSWEGRHYIKCSGAECRVSFDCDSEGRPLNHCRFCQGPVRVTKAGSGICVACDKWQDGPSVSALGLVSEKQSLPEKKACQRCGKPMRIIPSTKRGQFFVRCMECEITEIY